MAKQARSDPGRAGGARAAAETTEGLLDLALALTEWDGHADASPNGPQIALSKGLEVPVRRSGVSPIQRLDLPGSGSQRDSGRRKKTSMTATAAALDTTPAFFLASEPAPNETKLQRRDRVLMENLPLVKAIAVRVHESLPVHVELDDLVHAGILGLFDAATKFDPEKNVAFSSYAKHRIKGAILDSLRQLDWASRDMRRRHRMFEQATRELSGVLQRNPTEAEVAERMGLDVDRWRQMSLDLRSLGLISASTRSSEQDDLPAPDFPCHPDAMPDSMCAREQMRAKLGEAMSVLPERYKKVVRLYYTNELTMKEIGGVLGINESRVSQIHKAALQKMACALQTAGITSSRSF